MNPPDILGIGCATLDTIGTVDNWPYPDGAERIYDLEEHGGGVAATAMVAARRLGARAALLARVGDDPQGRKIIDGLRDEGVQTQGVAISKDERSMVAFCFANRKTAQRSKFYYRSQLRRFRLEEFDREALKRAPILLIDGHELPAAGQAAEIVRGAGGTTVCDAGSPRPGYREALPHIDYLVASWRFASGWTEQETPEAAIEALQWTGYHRAIIITLGQDGAIACQGGHAPWRVPAFRVHTRDTTGAGDAFHGAFCVGLKCRWPLEQNCVFASAVAALKCQRLGGRAGLPTWAETIEFLKEHARRYDWPVAAPVMPA